MAWFLEKLRTAQKCAKHSPRPYGFNREVAAELWEKLRGDPVKDVRETAGADEDDES